MSSNKGGLLAKPLERAGALRFAWVMRNARCTEGLHGPGKKIRTGHSLVRGHAMRPKEFVFVDKKTGTR